MRSSTPSLYAGVRLQYEVKMCKTLSLAFMFSCVLLQVHCSSDQCPHDGEYNVLTGKCLILIKSPSDFVTCVHECAKLGASVLSIDSDDERGMIFRKFIKRLLYSRHDDDDSHMYGNPMIWLNMVRISKDLYTDDAFRRLDGKRLKYTHWLPKNPDDAGGQACAVINSDDGSMDDYWCERSYVHCLCESGKSREPPYTLDGSRITDRFVLQLIREKMFISTEITYATTWILLLVILVVFLSLVFLVLCKFNSHSSS